MVQVFDPSVAKMIDIGAYVEGLEKIPVLVAREDLIGRMRQEIPQYQALLNILDASKFDHRVPKDFTASVLEWWRTNATEIPAWSEAARMIFAMKPTSANTERVFSRLKKFFPAERANCLMDQVQATLMLAFNSGMRDAEADVKKKLAPPTTTASAAEPT